MFINIQLFKPYFKITYQNLKDILFTETLQVCEQVVLTQGENGKMISKRIAQLMKDQLIIKGNSP